MFAILRVERIKNLSDLSAASRHGARNDSGTHYDPKRTKLNRHWRLGELVTAPVDLIEARKALIEQQGLTARANGAVAAEMLLSASGEFFFDEQTGELREDQLEVWLQRNIEAVNNRFPRMVAAMRLDLDEGTPHLSVFLVPHYTKATRHHRVPTISYRRIFGGETREEARLKMVQLQDWYSEEMLGLGLRRGTPKTTTHREHLTHHQYAARMRIDDEARKHAMAEAETSKAAAQMALVETQLALQSISERDAVIEQLTAELKGRIDSAVRLTVYARKAATTFGELSSNPAYLHGVARGVSRLDETKRQLQALVPDSVDYEPPLAEETPRF